MKNILTISGLRSAKRLTLAFFTSRWTLLVLLGDLLAIWSPMLQADSAPALQLLHSFNRADGTSPLGGVVQASDGMFYGTTQFGGSWDAGTVFGLNTDGTEFSLLKSFQPEFFPYGDGAYPNSGVVEGSDGALYGTTQQGGSNSEGTLFRINKDGTGYQVLCQAWNNGNFLEAADGRIYWMEGFDLMRIEVDLCVGEHTSKFLYAIGRAALGKLMREEFGMEAGQVRQSVLQNEL